MGSPPDTPLDVVAPHITAGQVILLGRKIEATADCLIRSFFEIGGIDYCQVEFLTDEIAPDSFKVVPLPRKIIRVPAMIRGLRV